MVGGNDFFKDGNLAHPNIPIEDKMACSQFGKSPGGGVKLY